MTGVKTETQQKFWPLAEVTDCELLGSAVIRNLDHTLPQPGAGRGVNDIRVIPRARDI